MKKFLKVLLMTLGALALAFIALMVYVGVFYEPGNGGPIVTFSVNDRQVQVFAPGSATSVHTSTSTPEEGQVVVRNRKIALRKDGTVLVDDKKIDVGNFTMLEVYVHKDQRVDTRVTRGGS